MRTSFILAYLVILAFLLLVFAVLCCYAICEWVFDGLWVLMLVYYNSLVGC